MFRSFLPLRCLRQGMAPSRGSVEAKSKTTFNKRLHLKKNQQGFLWPLREAQRVWVSDDFSRNATGRTGSPLFMGLRRHVPRVLRSILKMSGQNVSDFVP